MFRPFPLPASALRTCARHGLRPAKFFLTVNSSRQTLSVFEDFSFVRTFLCSTSRLGLGEVSGSHRTPRGLHRIARKIGGGWPVGTVLKARLPIGYTWAGHPGAPITTRILWLDGLEPGFNRGGAVDSHSRYIYIHGTGNELALGRPDSIGCIHLAAADLMPLYDRVPVGSLVWIE